MWHAGPMVNREGGSWDPYETLAEVQANTPWEEHGVAGDPAFWSYDAGDHDLFDYSWPDFHLTAASSNAIDRGTTALPASLTALLDAFDVDDYHWGAALDIGRYEGGFAILATPSTRAVGPGGVATYTLRLHPSDLPHAVTLSVASPSPELVVALDSTAVASNTVATLTVTHTHPGPVLVPGVWYAIPVTGTGGGFTRMTNVNLLVGGACLYLPAVFEDY
jgi:hypothetical protein